MSKKIDSYGEKNGGGRTRRPPLVSPQVSPKRPDLPRGCLYRHAKTGGYYLKIRWPGEKKISYEPLIPHGRPHATKQKGIALALAKRRLRYRLQGEAEHAATPTHMEHWVSLFQDKCRLRARAEDSGQPKFNANVCRRFISAAGITSPGDISPDSVEDYLLGMGTRSAKTRINHANALRLFCAFLTRQGVADNPFLYIESMQAPARPPRRVPVRVVGQLLHRTKGTPLHGPILVAAYCGLRLTEIRRLRWCDLEGEAMIVGAKTPTKSHGWRVVPLPAKVRRAIGRGDGEGLLFPAWKKKAYVDKFRALAVGLGTFGELPKGSVGNHWHALRAFCAMRHARSGMDIHRLMYLMGWKSMAMAQRYINIAQAAGR